LAYLLFHEVTWGKSLYRVIFFIPYIAPTVATAAVFSIIFGGDQNGAINQIFKAMGLPIQQWLRDPRGIVEKMYEAAQVDGAGRWGAFRNITIPLISPTTFFLTLLAIIGTFRAFTHLYVLRTPDQRGALDVATVYIFQIIREASPSIPYAAALSFLLFGIILILTAVQNRLSRDQVFYG
jgi:ABC-type sugar transport system permease subunit